MINSDQIRRLAEMPIQHVNEYCVWQQFDITREFFDELAAPGGPHFGDFLQSLIPREASGPLRRIVLRVDVERHRQGKVSPGRFAFVVAGYYGPPLKGRIVG